MFKIEKNVPLPADFKPSKRRMDLKGFLAKMVDGDSIFFPVAKSTVVTAYSEFKKTLPEDEKNLYEYVAIEREEEGEKGTRIWITILGKKNVD